MHVIWTILFVHERKMNFSNRGFSKYTKYRKGDGFQLSYNPFMVAIKIAPCE